MKWFKEQATLTHDYTADARRRKDPTLILESIDWGRGRYPIPETLADP